MLTSFLFCLLFKNVFFLLSPGGTFALYSLLCRHAKLSLLPNQQAADEELSSYKSDPSTDTATSSHFKRIFEKHKRLRTVLLLLVLSAAAMVIGNGVLTPAISGKVFLYFTFGVGAGAVILHFFQLKPPSPRLVLFIFLFLDRDYKWLLCFLAVLSSMSGLQATEKISTDGI